MIPVDRWIADEDNTSREVGYTLQVPEGPKIRYERNPHEVRFRQKTTTSPRRSLIAMVPTREPKTLAAKVNRTQHTQLSRLRSFLAFERKYTELGRGHPEEQRYIENLFARIKTI